MRRRTMFAEPGGRSALRAARKHNPRDQPCPTYKQENKLTPQDVRQGCADAQEGGY